jgi:hypothetical protein
MDMQYHFIANLLVRRALCQYQGNRSVHEENQRLSVDRQFVVDLANFAVIPYFGRGGNLQIWKEIKILGKACFSGAKLEALDFEAGTQITRIKEKCFYESSLQLLSIPQSVEMLGSDCFLSANVRSLTFESGSRLELLDTGCFRCCSMKSICLSPSIEVLGEKCFLNSNSNH